jgi:ABC-type multidrug transport system fused ATPase/permease subunit
MDTRIERQIQSALEKLLKGRTKFIIAHRQSTIRTSNQVLVIENGEIAERGRCVTDEFWNNAGYIGYQHTHLPMIRLSVSRRIGPLPSL